MCLCVCVSVFCLSDFFKLSKAAGVHVEPYDAPMATIESGKYVVHSNYGDLLPVAELATTSYQEEVGKVPRLA